MQSSTQLSGVSHQSTALNAPWIMIDFIRPNVLTHANGKYYYCYQSQDEATNNLAHIKEMLRIRVPGINKASVTHVSSYSSTPYRFWLTTEQQDLLCQNYL